MEDRGIDKDQCFFYLLSSIIRLLFSLKHFSNPQQQLKALDNFLNQRLECPDFWVRSLTSHLEKYRSMFHPKRTSVSGAFHLHLPGTC